MKIVIGTRTEQIELSGVAWIIMDTCELKMHTDGGQAVIEEVKDEKQDL